MGIVACLTIVGWTKAANSAAQGRANEWGPKGAKRQASMASRRAALVMNGLVMFRV